MTSPVDRRRVLFAGAAAGIGLATFRPSAATAADRGADPSPDVDAGPAAEAETQAVTYRWHAFGEPDGRGWRMPETQRLTDRLPARAEGIVPPSVWGRSRHSSGLYYRFKTDATALAARWTLPAGLTTAPYLTNAPANGLDLYGEDDGGRLRWVSWAQPDAGGTVQKGLLGSLNPPEDEVREFRLYLPLYNQTDDVQIGVPDGARIELLDPDPTPPIVWYGTSIVQGAGASRAGMSPPARLGRMLRNPVVGLGFSGVGRMELEVADLLAELDPAVYLLDCMPNMTPELVTERAAPFVRRLRQSRPRTPILLMEGRTRTNAWIRRIDDNEGLRAALWDSCRRLRAEGVRDLHYLHDRGMFGADSDGALDGSHPTDLGTDRMLELLAPAVRRII